MDGGDAGTPDGGDGGTLDGGDADILEGGVDGDLADDAAAEDSSDGT